MRAARTLLLGLVAAALGATGCGDDRAYTTVTGEQVDVRLDEYRIRPERIRVFAGPITFVAHDTGRLTHNLAVVQFDRPLGDEEERMYGEPTKTLFPGRTASTTVRLVPGKYRLVCTIANHDNLGQYAELKVVARR
jgi:plastocyanin